MINLLRSDLYRLFKTKAFYVCSLVALALSALGVFMTDWANHMASQNPEMVSTSLTSIKDGLSSGLQVFSDGNVHIFMAIFIAIFITAEFSHGTMKNAVSKGFQRYQIYLSKIVTMIVATYIMISIMFIFTTISATIVSGTFGVLTWNYLGQILAMIGVELLLHAALTSVYVMVAMVIRNGAGVIAINIIVVNSVVPLLYMALTYLFKNKIKFYDYGLRNNILSYLMSLTPPGEDVVRAIIVGLAFFAVTVAAGIFAFKNMDVK